MNERIGELYRQANEQARQQACAKNNTNRPQNNTVWNEFVPLFAELIVRQSAYHADVFSSMGCPDDMDPTETKPSDYIKKQMGITE